MNRNRKQERVNYKILKELQRELQGYLDKLNITKGYMFSKEFKESNDLPFGAHTAYKILNGCHVHHNSIKKALEYFSIDYEMNYGTIDKPLNE